ncbi:MAG: hypothetical protein IPO81_14435 [Kouleothrix sp.]|nr:hypothetical protein [Kouleothrix sp.]
MTERHGLFSIPARLLLTPEQRARLEAIVREREVDLTDLVSQIVAAYLDAQTDVRPVARPAPDTQAELRRRRAELASLRARRDAGRAPAWLGGYIAALEAEIDRLGQ